LKQTKRVKFDEPVNEQKINLRSQNKMLVDDENIQPNKTNEKDLLRTVYQTITSLSKSAIGSHQSLLTYDQIWNKI